MNGIVIDQEIIEKAVESYMQEFEQQERRKEIVRYEQRYKFLCLPMEHYHEYPTGSRKKEFIDYIMEFHHLAYREGITEGFYKVRHNLLVCHFILSTPMEKKEIRQKLGIKKLVYEKNIRKGLEELMIYAFGVDGLPPW